ncbi:HNH endonuclease [Actinoplanes sp. Pm04-4]|uniref:HNH endonuclease n=1 Tax=Paractinoplanes pyxinae TaxID=2997416 RepID=A0ABT4BFE3_9ACTN|nr:HNH endonuclease [Actinoplanes pyxinae]MCY1145259.1 HNH endonuclease [Actinoplanes pyxinae]
MKLPALDGGCHLYWGSTTNGYGQIREHGRTRYVHRIAAREAGMDIEGKTIDHLCRRRNCVNVAHLQVVSREENTRREKDETWRKFALFLLDQAKREGAA